MSEIEELAFGSSGYEDALDLRYRILREPLGVEWTDEERSWESRERHFALRAGGEVVACVSIRPLGGGCVKLRQMAVEPRCQGTGLGRRLLERVERVLSRDGVREIELHARDGATGFYERLGYRAQGAPFVEVGLLHRRMRKGLSGA